MYFDLSSTEMAYPDVNSQIKVQSKQSQQQLEMSIPCTCKPLSDMAKDLCCLKQAQHFRHRANGGPFRDLMVTHLQISGKPDVR